MSISETPETGGVDVSDAYAPVLDDSGYEVFDYTCKSENPPTEPDVLVDVSVGVEQFVRIPVVEAEMWVNKNGPSDLNRTAKIQFPAEWGDTDMTRFIQGFNSRGADEDDPSLLEPGSGAQENASYDLARVWFYDETNENYQITHFGYVGGVGPADQNGVYKFWVYDPADLMKGIPVSKAFADPTIANMLDFAVRGEDDNGDPVGLENRTVFEQVSPIKTYIAGTQSVRQQKAEITDFGVDLAGTPEFGNIVVGPLSVDPAEFITDIWDFTTGTELTSPLIGGGKSFRRNRNNMVDVLNWFSDRVGGKWHFEPTPSGPVLWYDNRRSEDTNEQLIRRTFVEDTLVESDELDTSGLEDFTLFDTVDTLDNQALRDMKPFNTLRLYGESSRPTRYTAAESNFADAASASAFGKAFPFVEVTYEPLLERADGYRLLKEVESEEKSLDAAEEAAMKQFRTAVEEETEGQMELKGEPYILPYDYIISIGVCNDIFTNVEQRQLRYEVNSVKHVRKSGERHTTELGVSLALRPDQITVESEYRGA